MRNLLTLALRCLALTASVSALLLTPEEMEQYRNPQ